MRENWTFNTTILDAADYIILYFLVQALLVELTLDACPKRYIAGRTQHMLDWLQHAEDALLQG